MPDLSDLIARLESAEEGSRELDAEIWAAFKGYTLVRPAPPGGWEFSDNGEMVLELSANIPPFSQSLDAKLPGENIVKVEKGVRLWGAIHRESDTQRFEGIAHTEALARRAAVLRSHQARMEKES